MLMGAVLVAMRSFMHLVSIICNASDRLLHDEADVMRVCLPS